MVEQGKTPQFNPGNLYRKWVKNAEEPTKALKQIGVMLRAESQGAFKAQAYGGKAWDARAGKINVYGIIADFAAGKRKPPDRRFDDRPALTDTGALKRSIAWEVVGSDTVQVGSNLPYGAVHQHGGAVESKTITADVQDRLAAWLLTKDDDTMIRKLGWLLHKRMTGTKLKGTVPARPFLGITKQGKDDIEEIIQTGLFGKG